MELNTRYGLDALDVSNLRRRWCRTVRDDCTFECFDDFLLWCSDNGYQKSYELRRRNVFQPHGPGNSYFWSAKEEKEEKAEETKSEKPDSQFCRNCQKECTNSMGCADWQKWFIKNWNDRISISPKLRGNVQVRSTWQYVHPDLIREGIVYGKA